MKLTVKDGCYAYRSGKPVLKDISFSASSGELIAVLGPNGVGKTTLLRCMMGFLKWSSGESLLDDRDIRSVPPRQLWKRIAYVPQARGTFAAFTAEEMILLGRTGRVGMFSAPDKSDLAVVHALMERLHITNLAGKKCSEISGGELQMVLIARALASEPELLVLDEPESNLDFKNQLIVLDTMSALTAQGICCIFNTHYPSHALTRATKSLLLGPHGHVFGSTASVVTEKNIQDAFGVKAVIGEIETPGNIYRQIIPLSVTAEPSDETGTADRRMIAVVAVIFSDFSLGEKINSLLHEYSRFLIGRMGMPYREGGVYIINATLDAPETEIARLSHKLGILPGVSVKTTATAAKEESGNDQP